MSTTANDLYNDAIVREARSAAERPRLPAPDVTVTRDNPLCGDRVTLDLALDDTSVTAAGHKTRGCLLTQAAAALLARRAAGASREELGRAAADLRAILRDETLGEDPAWPELMMFRPVRAIRSRHECVLLPFEALRGALLGEVPRRR